MGSWKASRKDPVFWRKIVSCMSNMRLNGVKMPAEWQPMGPEEGVKAHLAMNDKLYDAEELILSKANHLLGEDRCSSPEPFTIRHCPCCCEAPLIGTVDALRYSHRCDDGYFGFTALPRRCP